MRTIAEIEETLTTKRRPSHPGEILRTVLDEHDVSEQEFAAHVGIARHRLNEILNGKRSVTPDTALRLARALGTGPDVWLNLQLARDVWDALHSPKAQDIARIKPFSKIAV